MKKILGVMAVAVLLIAGLIAPAAATDTQTCKSLSDFNENYSEDQSGDWGSVDWLGSPGSDAHIELTVAEGYEVQLCLKKGSDGPEVTGWFGEGTYDLESTTYYPDLGDDGFSHYGFRFRPVPTDEPEQVWVCRDNTAVQIDETDLGEDENSYDTEEEALQDPACLEDEEEEPLTLTLVKDWDVTDEDDLWDEADASYTLLIDGVPFEGPVEVEDGQEIEISEDDVVVSDGCEFLGNDAGTYVVDAEDADEDGLITITVTNEVDCAAVLPTEPEEREPEEEPKVEETKVEKKVETEVLAETLPETGVSALLLSLLGLSAVGSGTAILRRRK